MLINNSSACDKFPTELFQVCSDGALQKDRGELKRST